MVTRADYPKTYRLGLFIDPVKAEERANNAHNQTVIGPKRVLTWTNYGNIRQANENISLCIETLTTDD